MISSTVRQRSSVPFSRRVRPDCSTDGSVLDACATSALMFLRIDNFRARGMAVHISRMASDFIVRKASMPFQPDADDGRTSMSRPVVDIPSGRTDAGRYRCAGVAELLTMSRHLICRRGCASWSTADLRSTAEGRTSAMEDGVVGNLRHPWSRRAETSRPSGPSASSMAMTMR